MFADESAGADPSNDRADEILGWAASLKPRRADSYRARLAARLA